MSPDELLDLALLVLFVGGLLVGFGSTLYRMISLRRGGKPQPHLIVRDLVLVGGLSLSFLLVAVRRLVDLPVVDEWWWSLLTAAPAIGAVWVYAYYEVLVIGHRRDRR